MLTENVIENKIVPDFKLMTTGTPSTSKLSDYSDKNIVIFFYPKDNTPICTAEAKAFRDYFEKFQQLDTVVFGISRDSVTKHENFKTKLGLPFELISDSSEELCNYFDVIAIKSFFGKKIRGIVRSTFLIDKNRVLRAEWRKIKVRGHIEQVLTALSAL
jgi:peroxiredoxin Q/BCP